MSKVDPYNDFDNLHIGNPKKQLDYVLSKGLHYVSHKLKVIFCKPDMSFQCGQRPKTV